MTIKWAEGRTEKAAPQPRNWAERLHSKQQKEYTAAKKPDYASAFAKWNAFIPDGGWIVSPKGANPITFEVMAGSLLAKTMLAGSYQQIGFGSRIVAGAIKENVETNRYAPERIFGHAGEVPTVLFSIPLPKA